MLEHMLTMPTQIFGVWPGLQIGRIKFSVPVQENGNFVISSTDPIAATEFNWPVVGDFGLSLSLS